MVYPSSPANGEVPLRLSARFAEKLGFSGSIMHNSAAPPPPSINPKRAAVEPQKNRKPTVKRSFTANRGAEPKPPVITFS